MGTQTATFRDKMSTWTFAAALLLPYQLAAVVVVISAVAQSHLSTLTKKGTTYGQLYSGAKVVLQVGAAELVMHSALPLAVRIAGGGLAYLATDVILVSAVVISKDHISSFRSMLSPKELAIEFATLAVATTAALMSKAGVPLIWLSLPAAMAIQRVAFRNEIRRDDSAPRPMTEKVWMAVSREVVHACATASVMRVDTSDPRTAATVAQLQAGCDAIGTVGHTGLAILLADCPGTNADSLALRLRSALVTNGVVAHVAVAAKPRDGQCLEDLLAVSEAELITRDAATRSARSIRPDDLS
jgi:hypothetical protein